MITTQDLIEKTGLTKQGVLLRKKKLGINPKKNNGVFNYSKEEAKSIIELNGNKTIERVMYKPLHTYINVMIIPSKMNFLNEDQL